jgi:hypothetical protein
MRYTAMRSVRDPQVHLLFVVFPLIALCTSAALFAMPHSAEPAVTCLSCARSTPSQS